MKEALNESKVNEKYIKIVNKIKEIKYKEILFIRKIG